MQYSKAYNILLLESFILHQCNYFVLSPPPRGHTSVYLCDHLRTNWNDFSQFKTAKGFSSFNQYTNNLIVWDYTNNYASVMKKDRVIINKKPNMYLDTISVQNEKLLPLSNGEVLDILNEINIHRDVVINETIKRGMKI